MLARLLVSFDSAVAWDPSDIYGGSPKVSETREQSLNVGDPLIISSGELVFLGLLGSIFETCLSLSVDLVDKRCVFKQ